MNRLGVSASTTKECTATTAAIIPHTSERAREPGGLIRPACWFACPAGLSQRVEGAQNDLVPGIGTGRLGAEYLTPAPRAGPALEEADHVTGDGGQAPARGDVGRGVVRHAQGDSLQIRPIRCSVEGVVHRGKDRGRTVGCAADHGAVDMREMLLRLGERGDAAIDADERVRQPGLEPADSPIIERRHLTVLLGRQSL
jgi:hypothetical protein